ncbi:hypothetical protein DICVIV_06592 [Dictyocaulus viviparus]|uniref:Uncharacterized protein n=1 Tax=Dictyocaulus viviparus TaxID=29172 RepID=A0A0D8XRT5_DICVI|nr:hypothetical protein DICVIV_06592 [Dictyocaulus viviparus]
MKKERPWYVEEVSFDNKLASEKDRRKSILGIGKGLLKKMRSSSALKSVISTDSSIVSAPFQRNKELIRFVANASMDKESDQSSERGTSTTTELSSFREMSYLGSAASLYTPSKDFGRCKPRGSVRSMPTESDLFRGLCNSAIRRTFSSASDSFASPQRFTRARSIRLREKLALSASMAELPEEEVPPTTSSVENGGEMKTPNTGERSSRRTSIVWSALRSKSRIFSSKKPTDGTPLCSSSIENSAVQENVTPLGRNLRRTSASSASIQKKVSSALKKGFGYEYCVFSIERSGGYLFLVRDSSTNLAGDQVQCTPAGILKRSSTNSKDRNRFSTNISRRCSDVSGIAIEELERQVRIEQKKKDAEEAKMYMEKIVISRKPVIEMLSRNAYDAVVIDVSATGLPVSSIAKEILDDIIYIVSEKDEVADKRVRIGVANGMREAFTDKKLENLIVYPFCISHEEEFTDYVIQQFLLASYKAFIWNQKAKTFAGTITLAGVSESNCSQIRRLYEELLQSEIRPKIAAAENLAVPLSEERQGA